MSNLEKWKQKKIKEIEEMTIDEVVESIMTNEWECAYCNYAHSIEEFRKRDCEDRNCRREIEDFLNS